MMNNTSRHVYGSLILCASALLALTLVGCGGGNSDDPIVEDYPIAYVKRPLPLDDNGDLIEQDVREPYAFNPGAELYVRERASISADERNITADIFPVEDGPYDVKDLSVSYDGRFLLFSLRAPEIPGADEEDQPKWNVWVYEFATGRKRRIITDDNVAEQGHDFGAAFLPSGGIVFTSTRQREAKKILIDEGKEGYTAVVESDGGRQTHASVLHVMNIDCTEFDRCKVDGISKLEQISANQSHDLDPSVLEDGRILFTRWDDAGPRNGMHLYTMNPDGTGLQPHYGVHSHLTGSDDSAAQFVKPRQTESGQIMVMHRAFDDTRWGANIVLIDAARYVDIDRTTFDNTDIDVTTNPGQRPATVLDVRTDGTPSAGGRFAAAYPLWDGSGRTLVSWSACRLLDVDVVVSCTDETLADTTLVEAPPAYGIDLVDLGSQTRRLIVTAQAGFMFTDVVAAQERKQIPEVILPVEGPDALYLANVDEGVLNIKSVYDLSNGTFDGCYFGECTSATGITTLADLANPANATALERPARFLRIEKAVSMPDENTLEDIPGSAFGAAGRGRGMREIIGYAPIEPDGSVKVKVPANVPLAITVLDDMGRRIGPQHLNWIQVRPAETVVCQGCHLHTENVGVASTWHARSDAAPASLNINLGGQIIGDAFFPGATVADLWVGELGQTMAEVRIQRNCTLGEACADLTPSVDLLFDDVWTDIGLRVPDASFAWRFTDMTTPLPVRADCLDEPDGGGWNPRCRITINYVTHIQPLWDAPRPDAVAMTDNVCTGCHSNTDPATGLPRVPEGQLELTSQPSAEEPDHVVSYRELLFGDNGQVLDDNGNVVDATIEVQATDPMTGEPLFDDMGNPVLITVPDPDATVGATMSANGARASARFFDRFRDPADQHYQLLNDAELKLLTEWLDLGGQYYNNPYDIPVN